MTATAEKAAEKLGPAAGAAVPFVPILVAVLGRRGIGGAAVRRFARRSAPQASQGEWVRPKGWRLPKNGTWEGTPGNSNFKPHIPAELGLKPGEVIPFRNGRPDFSKWSKGNFTSTEALTGHHATDLPKMIKTIAEKKGWTLTQVSEWLQKEKLSPHHAGGNDFQLVPWELHGNPSDVPPMNGIRHMGGAFDLRNK